MQIQFLGIVIGILLVTATINVPVLAFGTHLGPKATELVIDPLPECTNAFQCNATFFAGDIVTFTGILTDSTGRFVPKATIDIYNFKAASIQLVASADTERDGTFKATWEARFTDKKVAGETFKQQISEVFTIFAKFEGDNGYAPSQSGKMVITVKIKDILTFAATDKNLYREGDIGLIFINFIEADIRGNNVRYGDFIDPESMRVTYDNGPVQLSKKKTGSYTFATPPLTVGHHQLVITSVKEGYNTRVGFVTVQVTGFFGK